MCLPCLQDRCVYWKWDPGEEDTQSASKKRTIRSLYAAKTRFEAGMQWVPAQPASLTNQGTEPGQAAQSQQLQHRQLGWQGRGLSYGLHFLFAQGLLSFFCFFLPEINLNAL